MWLFVIIFQSKVFLFLSFCFHNNDKQKAVGKILAEFGYENVVFVMILGRFNWFELDGATSSLAWLKHLFKLYIIIATALDHAKIIQVEVNICLNMTYAYQRHQARISWSYPDSKQWQGLRYNPITELGENIP